MIQFFRIKNIESGAFKMTSKHANTMPDIWTVWYDITALNYSTFKVGDGDRTTVFTKSYTNTMMISI